MPYFSHSEKSCINATNKNILYKMRLDLPFLQSTQFSPSFPGREVEVSTTQAVALICSATSAYSFLALLTRGTWILGERLLLKSVNLTLFFFLEVPHKQKSVCQQPLSFCD